MSFPTTSTLDDFTRSDGALGSNWSTTPIYVGTGSPEISSDTAIPQDNEAGDAGAVWLPDAFDGSIEVWALVAGDEGHPAVYACMSDEDSSTGPSGYVLTLEAPGSPLLQLTRLDGPTGEGLDSWGITLGETSTGIGMAISGGTITVYSSSDGGDTWTEAGSYADDTYSAGDICFGWEQLVGSASAFTAFGGGGSDDGAGGQTIGDNPISGPVMPTAPPARRGLMLHVCDLSGDVIDLDSGPAVGRPLPVSTPQQPQVTIPLSDSRTGQIDISMFEPAAAALSAATSVVKVLYLNPKGDQVLVLNGIVMNPQADFDTAVVTVTLNDHAMRLQKRFLGYNHACILLATGVTVNADGQAYSEDVLDDVGLGRFYDINSDYGIPLDGYGIRLMLLDTSHGASDWPGGGFDDIPSMGIRYTIGTNSVDDANQQPTYGEDGIPYAGVGQVLPGSDTWEGFTATATEGSPTLTDVSVSGAYWTGVTASGEPTTPTLADIVEYAALDGPGIPDYCYVVSVDVDAETITMSANATASASYDVAGSDGGGENAFTAEAAIYAQLERGDNVYDDWLDMVQSQGAFEVNFIPIDKDNTGPSGAAWESGQFVELYTANRVGSDRSKGNTEGNNPVVFVHGQGGFHLTHSPDADYLITYEVQVGPGGPDYSYGQDELNKVTMMSDTVTDYGIWEDWEQNTSAGTGDTPVTNAILANRAAAVLTGYQNVPEFCTATIDTDSVCGYAYGTDFFEGDVVTVRGKRGYYEAGPIAMRIISVGISQVDAEGNCQLQLTLVPYLTSPPGLGSLDNY